MPGDPLPNGEQPIRADSLGLALQSERIDGLRVHRIAREFERSLPNEDLARGRRLFETGSRVDRIAGDEPLVPTSVSRDDLAGVDARPHDDRDAELCVEVAVQVRQGLSHLGCCAHGPDSVVFVNPRHAEDRHDPAPPMNFSTVPPCASKTVCTRSK